jgi:hypothetical protein
MGKHNTGSGDDVLGQEVLVIHFQISQLHHGGSFKERKRPTQTQRYTGI